MPDGVTGNEGSNEAPGVRAIGAEVELELAVVPVAVAVAVVGPKTGKSWPSRSPLHPLAAQTTRPASPEHKADRTLSNARCRLRNGHEDT